MNEELKHYVYALMDPRDEVIFYIGKGQGPRAMAHLIEASSTEIESRKLKRIRAIVDSGEKLRTLILAKEFERKGEAFAIESALIIQGRNSGEVMGVKCDLTNEQKGHHEGRFRLWGTSKEQAGFEFPEPVTNYDEAFEHCQSMYDYIIQNVPEFKNPIKSKGSYIRSKPSRYGFEFVVNPKKGRLIHFEYIGRKSKDKNQIHHAEQLRRLTGYDTEFTYQKIDSPRHDLSVDKHKDVSEALKGFIQDINSAEAAISGKRIAPA